MARNRLQSVTDDEPVGILTDARAHVWAWHAWQTKQDPAILRMMHNVIGFTKGGQIIGSVIYSRYRPPDIEIGIHTTDPAWCNRRTLKAMFEYPFVELGVNRVTATTDPANPAVCNFIKRLGFVEEGRLRQALPHGDLLILGMTRQECRWI